VRVNSKLALPVGVVIAGWVKGARSASARLARRIVGPIDRSSYATTIFPHAVTLLFASDVAVHLRRTRHHAGGASHSANRTLSTRAFRDNPCSATLNFVDHTINSVFDAIGHLSVDRAFINKVFGKGNWFSSALIDIGGFLSGGVNTAVDAARTVVLAGVRVPIKLVTQALSAVAATASLVGTLGNALSRWTGAIRAAPNPITRGAAPQAGSFTLAVTAPGSQFGWDPAITDCAKTFDVTLPTLTPHGAEVTWDVSSQSPAGLIVPGPLKTTLSALGLAQLPFATPAETPEELAGDEELGVVTALAQVHRTDLDELRDFLVSRIYGFLPDILAPLQATIKAKVTPLIDKALKGITTIQDIDAGPAALLVRYHTPKEPKPGPTGVAGMWHGTWASALGLSGTWQATLVQNGSTLSGSVGIGGIACNSGGPLSGGLNGNAISFGAIESGGPTISFTGTVNGNTMSGSFTTPGDGPCQGDSGTWSGSR
jgi:hypothetical protein